MQGLLGGGGGGGGGLGIDFQMHRIPVLGPLLFADPNEQFAREQLHRTAQAYQAMQPGVAQAQLNALMGASQFQQPSSNKMAEIYGEGYGVGAGNQGPMYASPIPPDMFNNPQLGPGPQAPGWSSQGQGNTSQGQGNNGGFLGGLPILGDVFRGGGLLGGLF